MTVTKSTPPPPKTQIVARHPLSRRVLAVAVRRLDGWACYIDAVPGNSHAQEQAEVAHTGAKASELVARVLFPSMKAITYAR